MAMKSYESFDAWLKDQSKRNQLTIKALRAFIRKNAPKLEEQVKWGNGCFIGKNNGVIYLYADREWVQYGFFNGVALSDPKRLLEGNSNYIRHIKVRSPQDIDKAYFASLLKQAVAKEAASPHLPTKNSPIFAGLSRPALSALAEAKITTLTKLAKMSEKEVLALHGVGPGSLPILRKTLESKGLAFKAEKVAKPKVKKTVTLKKPKKVVKKAAKKTAKKTSKKKTSRT